MKPLLALAFCCIARALAAGEAGPDVAAADRCAGLIALFDEVIVSRFDYRILMLEDYELADARECGSRPRTNARPARSSSAWT